MRVFALLRFLLLLLPLHPTSALRVSLTPQKLWSTSCSSSLSLSSTSPSHSLSSRYTAEVVGATGRIGSFWLDRHLSNDDEDNIKNEKIENEKNVIACPRGTSPGARTPIGTPIYVATPSDAYLQIFQDTIPSRRQDLVFVGNAGVPIDDEFRDCTILVPHFSVLYKNQWNSNKDNDNDNDNDYDASVYSTPSKIQVNTDPLTSPPTFIYGRHSNAAAKVLEANGIKTKIVHSFREIQAYSGRKLLWASCLWLLCHSHSDRNIDGGDDDTQLAPLTVGQVHEFRQDDLNRLVDELLPSLRELLLVEGDGEGDIEDEVDEQEQTKKIIDRNEIIDYLKAYSTSIAHAVPSIDLAKKEYRDRNAVWLLQKGQQHCQQEQPFHAELLKRQDIDV